LATRSRVALLADAKPRLAVELLRLEEALLLLDAALLLLGAALPRLLEAALRPPAAALRLLEEELLRPEEEPPRVDEERPPPEEAAPPSFATLSRVALLAEARPRLEVLLLAEAFEVEALLEEDFRAAERPPAAEAPSPAALLRF
jgi:hypothetical protein